MNPLKIFVLHLLAILSIPLLADEDLHYFELRTYYANPGKLEELHARFRDHTVALFAKHGMTNLAYWTPREDGGSTLVYLLGYPDKTSREKSRQAFRVDPGWQFSREVSEKDGKILIKGGVESAFLVPTDYSPLE